MDSIHTDEARELDLVLGDLETELPAAEAKIGTCRGGIYCI
ncbi:hypothetical protein [Kribbella italica]|uniref:Uncharacterized protein n=1 Tax=Kribbella italica TaxID=1540520 RepID=A0A7W9MUL9_9ACTN|nr:hypothetical protein [Kribbella italica]MBB5836103.1 hypothetical protein [Kribbella italica]